MNLYLWAKSSDMAFVLYVNAAIILSALYLTVPFLSTLFKLLNLTTKKTFYNLICRQSSAFCLCITLICTLGTAVITFSQLITIRQPFLIFVYLALFALLQLAVHYNFVQIRQKNSLWLAQTLLLALLPFVYVFIQKYGLQSNEILNYFTFTAAQLLTFLSFSLHSFSLVSILFLLWVICRRKQNDFGRDYYHFALKKISILSAFSILSFVTVLVVNYLIFPPEALNIFNIALLFSLVTSALIFIFVALHKNPLACKALIIISTLIFLSSLITTFQQKF